MKPIRRLLVATDGSDGSSAAAEVAAGLARDLRAEVDVVTVVDTSPLVEAYGDVAFRTERIDAIRGEARGQATRFAERHFADGARPAVHVRDGDTSREILQAARDLDSDLVIMGTHGRTGIAHVLIGSVAEKVMRASPIPVMTVRAP
jgi:nucleotide-binding universal stress UspA family protein